MDIHRDKRGILWVGTQQGLYRYNGTQLTVYDSAQTGKNYIPSSGIQAIDEDLKGNLLIATFGSGLLRWEPQASMFTKLSTENLQQDNFTIHLVVSKRGFAVTAGKTGPSIYSLNFDNLLDLYDTAELSASIGRTSALAVDSFGNVFMASESGLFKFSPADREVQKISVSNSDSFITQITAMTFQDSHTLYAGTTSGHILKIDLETNAVTAKKKVDETDSSSISQLEYHNNLLWVGTNHGLSYTSSTLEKTELFSIRNSLISSNQIYSLFPDDDSLWVGTAKGLNILTFSSFQTFNGRNSGTSNDIQTFAQDKQDRIWVGTYDGLYFLDQSIGSHKRMGIASSPPTLPDQRIMAIAPRNKKLWLGLRYGGIRIVDLSDKPGPALGISDLEGLSITKILHTEIGDTWIGTYNNGGYLVKATNSMPLIDQNFFPGQSVTHFLELRSNRILVGTETTLHEYDGSSDTFTLLDFHYAQKSENPIIMSVNMDSSGNLWIGTRYQGLFLWPFSKQMSRDMNLLKIHTANSLSTSTIYGIQFDSQGNIWCSTQSGLWKLDPEGKLIKQFKVADGLQANDFNFGASFKDSSGRIYFGGPNGYNRFVPEEVKIETIPPRMLLTDILYAGGNSQSLLDSTEVSSLQLTHKNYFVTFEFSVLDFLDPAGNRFRYKLDNFDPEWIDNGTRNTATYTNLPAGDYVFRVQGANSSGVWNREGISLDLRVLPAPWFSWWAYCSYALAALLLFWMIKRAYDSYSIERRAEERVAVMHAVAEKADDDLQEQLEVQDDLVQSSYEHNRVTLDLVSECISSGVDNLPEELAREASDGNSKRVAALTLLQDSVYFRAGEIVADMHSYTDALVTGLLRDSPVAPESITTINDVSPRLIPAALASPVSIAIYELLENCIQHAFNAAEANYIHIKFDISSPETEHRFYCLTVQDNGVGIPIDGRPQTLHTSGLAVVQAMTQRLSGNLNITGGKVTTVTLEIPEPASDIEV